MSLAYHLPALLPHLLGFFFGLPCSTVGSVARWVFLDLSASCHQSMLHSDAVVSCPACPIMAEGSQGTKQHLSGGAWSKSGDLGNEPKISPEINLLSVWFCWSHFLLKKQHHSRNVEKTNHLRELCSRILFFHRKMGRLKPRPTWFTWLPAWLPQRNWPECKRRCIRWCIQGGQVQLCLCEHSSGNHTFFAFWSRFPRKRWRVKSLSLSGSFSRIVGQVRLYRRIASAAILFDMWLFNHSEKCFFGAGEGFWKLGDPNLARFTWASSDWKPKFRVA